MLKAVCIVLGVAVNALPADIELAPNGRGTNFATLGGSTHGMTVGAGSQDCTTCYQQSDCFNNGCETASTDCCTTCSGNSDLCGVGIAGVQPCDFCTTSSPAPSPSPSTQDCTTCYQQSDCFNNGCETASTDCCTTCSGNSGLCGVGITGDQPCDFCTTSSPSPSPSPSPGGGAEPWKGASTPVIGVTDLATDFIGEAQYNSIAWTDGMIGETAPFDIKKPIAWTRGTLSKSYGEAGNAGFKHTTYTFTNVDLSNIPPGSVGTFYLVNLPGNGAEGVTATAGNRHGSFKAYADAQGCAGWSGNKEAGQVCAQASGQKQGDNNIAGEMDLFEANMYGFSTTSHGCQYEEPNFTGTFTGGTTTCNWGGNVLGVHASTPTAGAAAHVNLTAGSTPGTSCAGMLGPDGRAIKSDFYGPNAACYVNTLQPIDSIEVAISADGASFTTVIKQGANTLSGTQVTAPGMQAQADLPWTVVGAGWASETDWLDGITITPGTNQALCDPDYSDMMGNCNFAGIVGPSFTPTSLYCNGLGPDITADCPNDPSICCGLCHGVWAPSATRCVASKDVHLALEGISMDVGSPQ